MEPTVYISPTPFYKSRKFIILLFVVILILIPFSFYLFKIIFLKTPVPKPAEVSSEAAIKAEELPIALDILQNPMVYEWRGSVEGTLVAKDDKSITLTNDKGQSITIQIDTSPNGTRFFKPIKDSLKRKSTDSYVNLENIPIGTKLTGEFWVFLHQKNIMKGGSFTIIEP